MNKLVIAIVAVLVVFVGWNVVSKSKQNNSDNIYKLGIILPMTGDAAVYGEPMLNVYKLAVDEINAKGGINGNKLELVLEDGKCTGSNSASAATKLVNVDKVQVILGGFCSSESLASIPSAEAGKVAIVSGGSSSPDLTGKSIFFSRTYPSDSSQGSVLAQIAYDQGVRKVYAIYEQLDYPLGIFRTFESEFVKLGGTVQKEVFPTTMSDFKSIIAKAQGQSPDALLLIPQTPAAAERISQQIIDLKWKPKIFVGDIVITTPEILKEYSLFEGAIGATFAANVNSVVFKDFLKSYKNVYGSEVPYPGYAQTVYDSVSLVSKAIKEVGYDGEKIARWMRTVTDIEGVSGPITIDSMGDRVGGHQAKVVVNGVAVEYIK